MPRPIEVFTSERLADPNISPDTGFSITREYFRTAIELGLDRDFLNTENRQIIRTAFVRGINITERYLETDATLEEIGRDLRVSRERIRQIIGMTLSRLISATPEDLKEVFLHDGLETRKPLTLGSRIRISESGGGRTTKVLELLKEGKSLHEIEELGINNLSDVRMRLKAWGTEEQIGYIKTSDEVNPRITATISNFQSTDDEVQAALHQVRKGFYDTDAKKDSRLLTPISDLARESGYYLRNDKLRDIRAVLETAGLPVGEISYQVSEGKYKGKILTYHFIASIHRDRAVKILSEAEELQRFCSNPVQVIFGPEVIQIPNTTQLQGRRGFEYLIKAFRQAEIKAYPRHLSRFLGPDCPVPIFKMRHGIYFKNQDMDQLVNYLRSKIVV